MKRKLSILLITALMILIFIFTFLKAPEDISRMLEKITMDLAMLALINHVIFLALLIPALLFRKIRSLFLAILLLFLSGSAAIVSIIYAIPPNIIIFVTIFILAAIAFMKKDLHFDFKECRTVTKIIGIAALIFSFYYLHWIETNLFVNALFYSPLGIVNCPTLLAVCGLLCFLKKPGSILLEYFSAAVTCYFGFFGLMRLGAYVDIILIVCSLYLLLRVSRKLVPEKTG